ncbi:MAG: tRNA 2-selenouridine(34) synthase MnmH [Propionivibrio sp.]
MKPGLTQLVRYADLAAFDEIIDVRTPAEFAEDHAPGAINCPVLDDAQRVEVGTLYKQVSPFAAKKIGAAYVAENVARHLRERFLDRPKSWRPLVMCWRGGERSGAMTHILRRVGWDAQQLDGGYKAYRRLVVDTLVEQPRDFAFQVVCGATGSGKSRLLQALAARGAQVLDLEALACHKGSVLGVLPDADQPSQKAFETRLLAALAGLDPAHPVFVEAESRKIGRLHLPDTLLEGLRAGACIEVEAEFSARVEFLLRDYDYFLAAPDWLNQRLDALRPLQGHETVKRWQDLARSGAWRQLVSELLGQHYDPLYRRSQHHNFAGLATPRKLATEDLSPAGIDALAAQLHPAQPD